MKVMLHGATNMSNYGDYLFAEFFYRTLLNSGVVPVFYAHPKYGISNFFSSHLNYSTGKKSCKQDFDECDALVYISGGYFVGSPSHSILDEIKRINRYFKPARYFIKNRKPIYILGVGAGPFDNMPYSKMAKKILDYATCVTVRNEESRECCMDYGINNNIEVTADTALIVNRFLELYKREIPRFEIPDGEKMFLFHIDSNPTVTEQLRKAVIPAVKEFLRKNKEYKLFLAADGIKSEALYKEYVRLFDEMQPETLTYRDPWVLTRQIQRADIIVTTKLHMGVVGSAVGKSVFSFPFVPNKTVRFYKQIHEEGRCVPLFEVTAEKVRSLLETYKDREIVVPEELRELAYRNLELLPKKQ